MTIYKVDRLLAHVSSKLLFTAVNPTNIRSEQKKVFKDNHYNPEFNYRPPPKDLIKYRNALRKLKIPKTVVGKILHEKRVELLKQIYLIKTIGTKEFTKHSIAIYEKPNQALVQKAKQLLKLPPTIEGTKLGKMSIVKKFLDSCANHKFTCEVVEKEMAVKAAVNARKRKIYFNPHHSFTEGDIKRLILHEVRTHIRRVENAKKQKLQLFGIGFPYYQSTEEGLAVYNEHKAKVQTNSIIRQYAGRVIAVDLALKNPFNVVYTTLQNYFTDEEAYTITLRVKRGLKHTKQPGSHTKDHIYLKGFYMIKEFVRKGGNLKDLYVGKIGVEHVPLIAKMRKELGENNVH
tara:strand:+ start:22827 stop:23864 length:1038 start_codon:yes stop_codon:yes gene_type:complete